MQERLIVITESQLKDLAIDWIREGAKQALKERILDSTVTINQLVKEKEIGGYKRIKSLIETNQLRQLPDGKISRSEIERYKNNN